MITEVLANEIKLGREACVAEERERCAGIVDALASSFPAESPEHRLCEIIAKAIRSGT